METEVWKDIEGYEGLYQISNFGRVIYKGIIKIQRLNKKGYYIVGLSKFGLKTPLVHRLIAKAFIPNPENKKQVDHINGIRNDNRLENLRWATHGENQHYKYILGYKHPQHQIDSLRISGKRIGKLSRRNKNIIQYNMDGVLIKEWDSLSIAGITLGISIGNISSCCNGNYKHAGGFIWRFKK